MRTNILILFFLFVPGCTQVIVDLPDGTYVKANSFFKDIDIDKIKYKDLGIDRYKGDSKNMDALTPYGTIKTSD